jgi:glycosyltransferase involved in cell wall biosynthesis
VSTRKKILIICPFPQGVAAGQRLKYEQYFDHWIENGYEISVSPFMNMNMWNIVYSEGNYIKKILGTIRGYIARVKDIFSLSDYDLVYVFMWVTPFKTTFFEKIFRYKSKRLVFDIEDNALIAVKNNINGLVGLLKGSNNIIYLIKTADHVITSSPFLEKSALSINLNNKATYISSSINTNVFLPCNDYKNSKEITIGWTGTFSSKKYLDTIRDVLIKLSKTHKFKLLIIGNFMYDIPGLNIEVIQWSKANEVVDLQRIDIGIYPLIDDDWVLGKSGLKALQYMAFGLPVVASSVGTSPLIINHLDNGLLVKTDKEWLDALSLLLEDNQLRKKIGKKARQTVIENYSIMATKDKYLSIINKTI